jgi:hypothetical protein
MKRIIHWLKNDLFYYRIITCHDDGHDMKILYMNKTAAITTIVSVSALMSWVILKWT